VALNQIVKIVSSTFSVFRRAPGKTVNVKAQALGGVTIEAELMQSGGILHSPPRNARGILIPIGEGSRASVVIACQNYDLAIDITPGETVIYSTDSAGAHAAKIKLDAAGKIDLNGDTKNLVTHAELQSALTTLCATLAAHVHPSNGVVSPGLVALGCNISAAKTDTIRTGG
jgi:phage gp45-like